MRWFSFLIVTVILLITTHFAFGALTGSLDEKSIEQRLKPLAEVTLEGGNTSNAPSVTTSTATASVDIGQQKYDEVCKMCHETGLAGAPKFGDKAEWSARIAQGMDTLVKHAIIGLKAMPPKGGCSTCSDEEIKKAVEYMVEHAK